MYRSFAERRLSALGIRDVLGRFSVRSENIPKGGWTSLKHSVGIRYVFRSNRKTVWKLTGCRALFSDTLQPVFGWYSVWFSDGFRYVWIQTEYHLKRAVRPVPGCSLGSPVRWISWAQSLVVESLQLDISVLGTFIPGLIKNKMLDLLKVVNMLANKLLLGRNMPQNGCLLWLEN